MSRTRFKFILELKVRNHSIMTNVRCFRFKVQHENEILTTQEYDYDPLENALVLTSEACGHLDSGVHKMIVEVVSTSCFSGEDDDEEIYSHFQLFNVKKKIAPHTTIEDLQRGV